MGRLYWNLTALSNSSSKSLHCNLLSEYYFCHTVTTTLKLGSNPSYLTMSVSNKERKKLVFFQKGRVGRNHFPTFVIR